MELYPPTHECTQHQKELAGAAMLYTSVYQHAYNDNANMLVFTNLVC